MSHIKIVFFTLLILTSSVLISGCSFNKKNLVQAVPVVALKDFNTTSYSQDLSDNKTILLYFTSSWCQSCNEEMVDLKSALKDNHNQNFSAYKVNFNDANTSVDEKNLAKEQDVIFQHTKVIIQNQKQVFKNLDVLNKVQYLEIFSKLYEK